MSALGELILADPNSHSFLESIKKYLGKCAEFLAGWTYWACWLSLAMADLTATGVYLRYWFPWLPQWVGSLVIVVLLMLINMVNVGLFGELESWFSMIKVIAIVALIVTGAVMIVLQTKVKGGTAADPHKDIPMNALMTSSTILFVVVILNYVMPARIFDVVSTVSTICFVIIWIMIMAAHVVYRRQNKDNLGEFRMPVIL